MSHLYKEGAGYSRVAFSRSAISAYHQPIQNVPVGQLPRVFALVAGVFNLRPPTPVTPFVWNVEDVLHYLSSLPSNKELSISLMTHKMAILLALTASSRAHEICFLNTNFMCRTEHSYIFTFDKLTKSWRQGKPHLSVEYHDFESEPKLCVVAALDHYLDLTKGWRDGGQKSQLLLATIKPHGEVKPSTVSGWLKKVLVKAVLG